MSHLIPIPKTLSLHEGNVAENWRKFQAAWTNYELAADFSTKDDAIRVALLLSVIGEEAVEVYNTFQWAVKDDHQKIKPVLAAFETYCIPRKNVMFETYRFACRKQEDGEPIDAYVTVLRRLADNCEFGDKDRRLRDQVVLGLRDEKVRERLLRETDPDLKKVLQIVRAQEVAVQQAQVMAQEKSEEAHQVQRRKGSHNQNVRGGGKKDSSGQRRSSPHPPSQKKQDHKSCKFCGRGHKFGKKEDCPAWGKSCKKCNGMNHFAQCCKETKKDTNAVQHVEQVTIFSVGAAHSKKTKTVRVEESGKQLTFQIDTGASCNVLSWKDYKRVTGDMSGKKLIPKVVQLKTYGGKLWSSKGECHLNVVDGKNRHRITAVVVDIQAHPLLCLKTSEDLGIVKIINCDQEVNAVENVKGLKKEDILKKFPEVFDGLGKLEGKYRIYMDDSVKPVVHPPRKFPVPVREELQKRLAEMESWGVIAKVTEPTDWVSSLLVVVEPTKLRICLDPRDLNKAIKREHYPLPCIEEVATRLSDVKVFSVLDATKGFWQVELEEESSYLTTFNTPFGRYRWRRMPFGISSAPEVWQRRMHDFVEDLDGVEVIADDFLVCGRGKTMDEAIQNHDQNLIKLLKKAKQKKLTLNPNKMKIKLQEVTFIGHLLTREGVKVDPKKVEAVLKMPTPEDAAAVMRFLGMVQYCAKFLPRLSDVTEPMRRLTDKDAEWNWKSVHEEAFQEVKRMMTTAPVLAYYDSKKPVVIQCDSSQSGIGAVLMQDGKPVHFSSRAMTPTETRYAQIEKEMLAIVHSCSRFEQYIYGRRDVKVETDHKPLEMIFKKPIASAPKRLQRMLLFLQKFQLNVVYKKGAEMYLADTLSRAYLKTTAGDKLNEVLWVKSEEKICSEVERISVVSSVQNSKKRIEEIRKATLEDHVLRKVTRSVLDGVWDKSTELHPYFLIRDELTEEDGSLYKGARMVIPQKMRREVMQNLHQGHIGIENTLRRAREHVYWPGMNAEVKDFISKCDICNSMRKEQAKEPMMSHEVPDRAWKTLSSDIFKFQGIDYVIVVDHYSDYFEYEALGTATTAGVVKFLKKTFTRYGIPETFISDNGTQYSSREFRKFAEDWEFDSVTSSPHYPKSNGKSESAVKTCKSLMKKALAGKGDFYKSLLDWRNTPTAETMLSPVQRLFGRRTRTTLPTKEALLKPMVPAGVAEKKVNAREKAASYYNRSSKELKELADGVTVRIKLPGDKTWSKGIVLRKVNRRSFMIRAQGGEYRRNRKDILLTSEDPPSASDLADPDMDAEDVGVDPPPEEEVPRRRRRRVEVPVEPEEVQIPRRSGRIRRAPDRYSP